MVDTGGVPYLTFLAPGIIAQSALFIWILRIQIIWDRDAGIPGCFMVTPSPRRRCTGKAFAAGVRSGAGARRRVLAYLMARGDDGQPAAILAAMGCGVFGLAFFRVPVDDVAGPVRKRDRLMGTGPWAITMPLFASARHPAHIAPPAALVAPPSTHPADRGHPCCAG